MVFSITDKYSGSMIKLLQEIAKSETVAAFIIYLIKTGSYKLST